MNHGSSFFYVVVASLLWVNLGLSEAQIDIPMCDLQDELPDQIPILLNGGTSFLSDITKVHQPIKCHTDFELSLGKEQFSDAYLSVNEKDELDFAFQLGDYDYTVGSRHFCIWKNDTNYYVRTCHPTTHIYETDTPSSITQVSSCYKSERACVSKCCPLGQVVEIGPTEFGCVESKTKLHFNPRFLFTNSTDQMALNVSSLNVVVKFHYCKIYDPNYFSLSTNGTLTLLHTLERLKSNAFCLDHFSVQGRIFGMRGSICSKTVRSITTVELLGDTLRPFCLYLSTFCLSILLFCHVVARKLRDFQGICYMNYILAILLSNAFSYFVHKFFDWDSTDTACYVLFIISYGCMLTSTLWLLVMVFHVWETYRLLTVKNTRGCAPIAKYYFFTWGSSLLICMIAIAIQLTEEGDPEGINVHKCQFPDSTTWLMMSNGVSVTVLLVLFAVVIVYAMALNLVVKFHQRVELTPSEIELRKQASSTIKGRLFLLLLATAIWVFELLSAVTNEKMKLTSAIIASLQGFFVSLEFIGSKTRRKIVVEAFKKKMRKRRGAPQAAVAHRDVELRQAPQHNHTNSIHRDPMDDC